MNNIYMVGGISFQTGHGKLKLSGRGKKIVPSYPESRKKIGNFNFLRLNYRKFNSLLRRRFRQSNPTKQN